MDYRNKKECRLFLCYRENGAETAKLLADTVSNNVSRFGKVWYSDYEGEGNYILDIDSLLSSAEYSIIFITENFTKGFLNADGTNNINSKESCKTDCVTVREIIEIERQRQLRGLRIISVNIEGYTFSEEDLEIIKHVFENAGVLREDSIAFYKNLQINRYIRRSTSMDEFIKRILKNAEISAENNKPKSSSDNKSIYALSSNEPISKKMFVPNQSVLFKIKSFLDSPSHICYIYGTGGIGKTQTASRYANDFRHLYDTVVLAVYKDSITDTFIDDNGPFRITNIRRMISDTIKAEPREEYFKRKLDALKKLSGARKLIIIDNFDVSYEDLGQDLFDFINGCKNSNCDLLFTTRTDFSEYFKEIVNLDDYLDEAYAIQIFNNYFGAPVPADQIDDLNVLLANIKYHTLTVELIAKHMKATGITPLELLECFKEKGVFAIDSFVKPPSLGQYFSEAYEYICALFDMDSLCEGERNILTNLSLMPISGIPLSDFLSWTKKRYNIHFANLSSRSWIIHDQYTNTVSMHPIVVEVCRSKLNPNIDSCSDLLDTAHDFFREAKNNISKKKWSEALKLLLIIYPWTEQLLSYDNTLNIEICESIAFCYYSLSCFSEAYEYYYPLCRKYIENNHEVPTERSLECLHYLTICIANGKYQFQKAYDLRVRNLEYAQKLYGSNFSKTIKYLEALANSSSYIKGHSESLKIRRQIHEYYESAPNIPIGDRIYSLSTLSNSEMYAENYNTACVMRQKVRKMLLDSFGPDHIAYHISGSNLACTYITLQKYEEAFSLLKESAKAVAKIKGNNDFYSLSVQTNLGAAMLFINSVDAIGYNEELYKTQSKILGSDSTIVLKSYANLANAYYYIGDFENAYKIEEEVLARASRSEEFSQALIQCLINDHTITSAAINGESCELARTWYTVTLLLPSIK